MLKIYFHVIKHGAHDGNNLKNKAINTLQWYGVWSYSLVSFQITTASYLGKDSSGEGRVRTIDLFLPKLKG